MPTSLGTDKAFVQHGVKTDVWDAGPDHFAQEPIFCSRPGAEEEDDGWIFSMVYNARADSSYLAILNAKDLEAGPVARIKLPHKIPYGMLQKSVSVTLSTYIRPRVMHVMHMSSPQSCCDRCKCSCTIRAIASTAMILKCGSHCVLHALCYCYQDCLSTLRRYDLCMQVSTAVSQSNIWHQQRLGNSTSMTFAMALAAVLNPNTARFGLPALTVCQLIYLVC